ncbi:unnamed protein product [Rotaria socialis]|uniref:Uncharacterized protein n=1 Tax=Rotaria socialis TaxID=392032 RepID=A0A820LNU6_9BILA|nr:unnamed protein product [Rotaria socialis]
MGRLMSWQTVSPNLANSSTVTIQLTQTYAWQYAMIVDKYVFSNRCTSQYTTTTSYSNATVVVASTITYECGGACQDLPGAQLYSTSNINNNCTLAFSTTAVGYYGIAI